MTQGVRILKRIPLILALATLALAPAVAEPAAPDAVIREAIDLLQQGLDTRHDELAANKQALYEFIDGILLPRFERRFAAMAVLGTHWKSATTEQQDRFIEAFYETLLHRYAEGVLEFDTSRIEVLPFRGNSTGRYATVKTNVTLDDGDKVPVNYDLVKVGDSWRMFNVNIEGVSYIVNFRTEFDTEIENSSLAAVIDRLESEAGIKSSG